MNFVGKIFVVLQLIFSVALMGFAGAVFTAQQNWRAEAERLDGDLQAARRTIGEKDTEIQQVKTTATAEQNKLTDQVTGLQAQLTAAEQQRAVLADRVVQAETKQARDSELQRVAAAEAAVRRTEALELRKINKTLHDDLDQKTLANQKLTERVFDQGIELARIKKKHDDLYAQHLLARRLMAQEQIKFDPNDPTLLGDETPVPVVVGHVLETRTGKNRDVQYIQISLGSDDELAAGHELFIYRVGDKNGNRPKYLGKLQIKDVSTDSAVGIVTERVKTGEIQKGDHVSTQL